MTLIDEGITFIGDNAKLVSFKKECEMECIVLTCNQAQALADERNFDQAISLLDNVLQYVTEKSEIEKKRMAIESLRPLNFMDVLEAYGTDWSYRIITSPTSVCGMKFDSGFRLGDGSLSKEYCSFNLNHEYSKICGKFAIAKSAYYDNTNVQILVDDTEKLTKMINKGDLLTEFEIDVTNCDKISFAVDRGYVAFVDMELYR